MTSTAPWLAHYDAGVPPTLAPYPRRTLVDYVSGTARNRPGHPALLFKGASLSYAALERMSDACAAAFAALGIRRGDRVALLLPNCPQFFVAELGAWKLGAIVAPLNPTYTDHELEGPLREHGVETIVLLTRFYNRIKNIQHRTPVRHVIATNIKEHFPPILRTLFTLFRETREGDRILLAQGDHDLAAMVRRHARDPAPREPLTPDDPAVLLMALDDRGFRVSAGSLCSGRPEDPSSVLEQIGRPATSGFRVGLGPTTTQAQVDDFLAVLPEVAAQLRKVERSSSEALLRFRSPEGSDA